MDWVVVGVSAFILLTGGLMLWFKLKGRVTDEQIVSYLKDGAIVVDVRTSVEVAERRVDGTINIPLDKVVEGVVSSVPDKSQIILCHCESGGRSAIAVARLRRVGYAHAFNLGSFNRAAALLNAQK